MRWVWLVAMGCVTRGELEAALDRDGDGYLPVVAGGPDCDETRAEVNPGAVEACGDGIDNDCDGRIDDAGVGERTWYRDDDGDGFGIDETVRACSEPEGYAPVLGDCVDDDASINPGVLDLCDGVDQDCDGRIDDDVDALVQYRDADGDGFGTDSDTLTGCGQTPGYVLVSGDCDDAVAAINPAVEDTCDGVDQNCNGVVDEDVAFTVQYRDADGDGDGNPFDVVSACELLPGYVGTANDCDDQDPTRFTNAFDYCDGIDQDCDGIYDDDVPFALYYLDEDGDGAGSEPAVADSCEPVPGLTTVLGDCDDHDDTISPLLADTCDGVDSDCDGAIDDDALLTLYFPDADEDGVGTTLGAVEACIPPPGFVQLDGDCDDHDPTLRPDSLDGCDGIDTDCDGAIDDDATFTLWWNDHDGDGAGTGTPVYVCQAPAASAQVDGDCDDTDPNVRPGITDGCDGVDSDCDGLVDQDASFSLWFRDDDGDGMGRTNAPASTCDGAPTGFVETPGDCDDADSDVTIPVWYRDDDDDGWGVEDEFVGCVQPAGFTDRQGDCDDSDGLRNPGLVEVCNNHRDDDCDATTDCRRYGNQLAGNADFLIPGPMDGSVSLVQGLGGVPGADFVVTYEDRIEVLPASTDVDFEAASPWTIEDCRAPAPALDPAGPGLIIVCTDTTQADTVRFHRRDEPGPFMEYTAPAARSSTTEVDPDSPCGPGFWAEAGGETVYVPATSGATGPSDAASRLAAGLGPRLEPVELTGGFGGVLAMGSDLSLYLFDMSDCPAVLSPVDSLASSQLAADDAIIEHQPAFQTPLLGTLHYGGTRPYLDVCVIEPPLDHHSSLDGADLECIQGNAYGVLSSVPVGDLDGDGFEDWAIGMQPEIGVLTMSVVYGVENSLPSPSSPGFVMPIGTEADFALFDHVDIDDDGFSDFVFSTQIDDEPSQVHVFLGRGI